ncbi:unnamed protein product [Dibothriocephalus latus]|uniref:Uncharacterized protein n=1 Tax=Dibothriocephalus latus TaxID=60516 RepID=A0A3P7MZ55_DIBLA|nr:unnamed protein product [Dibothriocephalus latus]
MYSSQGASRSKDDNNPAGSAPQTSGETYQYGHPRDVSKDAKMSSSQWPSRSKEETNPAARAPQPCGETYQYGYTKYAYKAAKKSSSQWASGPKDETVCLKDARKSERQGIGRWVREAIPASSAHIQTEISNGIRRSGDVALHDNRQAMLGATCPICSRRVETPLQMTAYYSKPVCNECRRSAERLDNHGSQEVADPRYPLCPRRIERPPQRTEVALQNNQQEVEAVRPTHRERITFTNCGVTFLLGLPRRFVNWLYTKLTCH